MQVSEEPSGRARAWVLAVLGPALAAAVLVAVRAHTQPSNLALIMVVVVAVSVAPGHRLASVASGLSAGVWFDFFLTRPYEHFSIQRSADAQTTVLLALVAVVIGDIAARRRVARTRGRVAREEMIGLYVVAQMLSAGAKTETIVATVTDQLRDLLRLASCRFEPHRPGEDDAVVNRAGELENYRGWSVAANGLPAVDVSLPVDANGATVGRFVLRGPEPGVPLDTDRLLAAVALADLVGAAVQPGDRATH